jgi:hypothetical protein
MTPSPVGPDEFSSWLRGVVVNRRPRGKIRAEDAGVMTRTGFDGPELGL